MRTYDTSKCIECGKRRIVVETHKEKVGNSEVVYKKTICPDPECQKKVDKILARELKNRKQAAQNQKLRLEARKKAAERKKAVLKKTKKA